MDKEVVLEMRGGAGIETLMPKQVASGIEIGKDAICELKVLCTLESECFPMVRNSYWTDSFRYSRIFSLPTSLSTRSLQRTIFSEMR